MIQLIDKNIFSSMASSTLRGNDKLLGSLLTTIFKIGAESGNPQWAQSYYSYHKISYLLYENDFSDEEIFYIADIIDKVSFHKIGLTMKIFSDITEKAHLLTIGARSYCTLIKSPNENELPDLLSERELLDKNRYLRTSDFTRRCNILVKSLENLGYSACLNYDNWNMHRPKIREYISSFKERNGM